MSSDLKDLETWLKGLGEEIKKSIEADNKPQYGGSKVKYGS